MTNPNIPPEIADATPAPAPVRMVSIRASTLEHVRSAIACALETNHTSNADMRIRWGLSEGRCVIEQVERILCDALTALDSGSQEVAEPVRMRWQVRDCRRTALNYASVNTSAVSHDDVREAQKFLESCP